MTDIISTVQKQDPGSELVVLYELDLGKDEVARFANGTKDNAAASIHFRDSSNESKEYSPIPILAEGFDISSDGAYSRPTITIGNIGNSFSGEIAAGLDYEDLLGKRITRIMTFGKYLVGGASDNENAPGVHLPKIVYIIDRIVEKNILQVTFELASPFDLAGVTLPRRTVVGGACTWRYQDGRKSIARENRVGACTWEGGEGNTTTGTPVFVNSEDEYIMNFDPSTATLFASIVVNGIYYTTKVHDNGNKLGTVVKLNDNGTTTDAFDEKEFWQAVSSAGGVPGYANGAYRRVHPYSTWNNSTVYNGYSDPRLNDYVTHSGKLWRVKRTVVPAGTTPATGKYWIEGDICRKTIASCKMRYMAKTGTVSGHGSNPLTLTAQDHTKFLPYGGFPGVQSRR